ncbi:dihydroorotase [Chroogloeocystis siderophila]|jgi:dihydroorotase|uniref:Dihydroorotase n=1 Tax=Chroogloeocystis siderophila 5.2 s.c.1 TaxID=247279 RepID=A0A1U7HZT9_9CHRO|nr:dihydroorotase [Chroogloeocystis siderophila]OKH29090.1 dihydroorotase [Chroogloeocystis siderophila 5.2 s.c.1]
MKSELLQQVRVIDPVSSTDRVADVLVVDGLIQALQETIADYSTNTQVRNCRGLVLGPGLVDLYSHSGEPGFEERETWRSLIDAATAGGFTRLHVLPDTMPALDNLSVVSRLQQELAAATVKVKFWAALTVGVKGQQMTELAELVAESNVVGFADGRAIENLALLRRLLEYIKPINKPVALWACDAQLAGNGVMREGTQSIRFGLSGNPAIAETAALAAILEVVAAIGTPVHIMRISTARGVELIQAAKAQGLPITASTTWMHLLLDTQAVKSYNPSLRLEPPLGNTSDVQALRQGVRSGIIDAIAVDHTPYTYEEKTVAFAEAPAGAIGLELALPLLWQNLVETGELSAVELWRSLSTCPSQCLQQNPSAISPDTSAEMVLFDPHQVWQLQVHTLKSLSSNTPWLGQTLQGRVVQTWYKN